jgi:hypothetical protein
MARKKSEKPAPVASLFLVQRLAWSVGVMPTSRQVHYEHADKDGGVAVAACASRERAEALAERLTAQARRELSPFWFMFPGALEDVSTLRAATWARYLKALGLKAPTKRSFPDGDDVNWQGWFDCVAGGLSDEQRQGVWELCDRLKLYEVVEVAVEG